MSTMGQGPGLGWSVMLTITDRKGRTRVEFGLLSWSDSAVPSKRRNHRDYAQTQAKDHQ